jgi:hypothetical protein
LVRESAWKIPLWKLRLEWENIIKVDLEKIAREGVDLILLTEDRTQCQAVMNTVLIFEFHQRLRIPGMAIKFSISKILHGVSFHSYINLVRYI